MNLIFDTLFWVVAHPFHLVLGLTVIGILVYSMWTKFLDYRLKQYQHDVIIEEVNHNNMVKKIDPSTNLTEIFNEALDEYDRAGIRIPVDIIEDLQHEEFKSVDEAIQSIENQRTNWKLENQKKLNRRKVYGY